MSSDDEYVDDLFLIFETRLGKCSCCNNEGQICAPCLVENCNHLICKKCYASGDGKHGMLEFHMLQDEYQTYCNLWLSTLAHLSGCVPTSEQPCLSVQCSRTRELMMHLKDCKKRIDDQCLKCRRVLVGMALHASHCNLPKCNLSYCRDISEFKRM